MKKYLLLILLLPALGSGAQELYVFSDPASNLPANALSVKVSEHFLSRGRINKQFTNRLMPQVLFGISKKWQLSLSGTLANMHTATFRTESANLNIKYRFLSHDQLHKHFRMAVFAEASATRAPFHFDEITLMGDKDGIEAGVIATQLWHKLALSGTLSHTQVLHPSRKDNVIYVPSRKYESLNYSVSAGYLLFPRQYTDYRQTNLNLYLEWLGQQTLDRKSYYLDMAPALQLIFNSNAKLNLGYRFQLSGSMQRMTRSSWLLSFERSFLGALKKKK